MYKLIACDIDETLLTDSKQLTDQNKKTIEEARSKGAKFVLTTGRGFPSVQPILEELGLADLANEYVISYNGGAITENKNNRLIEVNPLDFDLASSLFQFGVKHQLCMHIYTLEDVYIYNPTQEEKDYITGRLDGWKLWKSNSLSALKDLVIVKMLYHYPDYHHLPTIENKLPTEATTQLTLSYSANRYLELNARGVTKGKAMLDLAEKLGITQAKTMAIGDNLNDVDMLKKAACKVAVKNARPAVKEVATYICQHTNNDSAVAEAIEKFVL